MKKYEEYLDELFEGEFLKGLYPQTQDLIRQKLDILAAQIKKAKAGGFKRMTKQGKYKNAQIALAQKAIAAIKQDPKVDDDEDVWREINASTEIDKPLIDDNNFFDYLDSFQEESSAGINTGGLGNYIFADKIGKLQKRTPSKKKKKKKKKSKSK